MNLDKNINDLVENACENIESKVFNHFVEEANEHALIFNCSTLYAYNNCSQGLKDYVLKKIVEQLRLNGYYVDIDYDKDYNDLIRISI